LKEDPTQLFTAEERRLITPGRQFFRKKRKAATGNKKYFLPRSYLLDPVALAEAATTRLSLRLPLSFS
jgi:hypothetical protein